MKTFLLQVFPYRLRGKYHHFLLQFERIFLLCPEEASSMVWDDTFWVMLLSHDFYKKFIKDKEIADNKKTSGALISFSMDNADKVKKFAQIAKENGGTFHEVDMGIPEEEI